MFNKLKKFLKGKEDPEKYIILANKSFTVEDAKKIRERTGRVVILTQDVNDIKILNSEPVDVGDGNAVFFGEGSEEEWKEEEHTKKFGIKKLFGIE